MSDHPDPNPPEPDRTPAGDIALRHTFRVTLTSAPAGELDRAVEAAMETDAEPVTMPIAAEAAAGDLDSLAAYLSDWADNLGDGVEREHIRLAGAVLDAVPVIRRTAATLRAHGRQAGEPAPTPAPPECTEVERDRPALREVYARQLRVEERETLERLADNLLELSREGSPAVRDAIHCGAFDAEVAAVAADLRHVELFLRVLGAAEGNVLERWESRLADLAERVATPVGEVARQLEAAVAEVAP